MPKVLSSGTKIASAGEAKAYRKAKALSRRSKIASSGEATHLMRLARLPQNSLIRGKHCLAVLR